jgi:23S rRNA (cytosine1962-C5)-methyltransferase
VRGLEGLEPTTGWLHGEPPTAGLSIDENGVQLAVDVVGGHKTGFYLDQRDNRAWLRSVAAGKEILNCFCYTGGFSLQALAGGRRMCCPSIRPARRWPRPGPIWRSIRSCRPSVRWLEADVFQALRDFRKAGRTFDLIVLDPPKFAPSAAHADRAARPTRTSTCSASVCSSRAAC